jgi:uncharacterized protein DUF1360
MDAVNILEFGVQALAVARLTRLVVADEITREARESILKQLNEESRLGLKLAYLLVCTWCASIWVAGAVMGGTHFLGNWILWWLALSTMAGSQIAGMLGEISSFLTEHSSLDDK